jgi:hypothetical protein
VIATCAAHHVDFEVHVEKGGERLQPMRQRSFAGRR